MPKRRYKNKVTSPRGAIVIQIQTKRKNEADASRRWRKFGFLAATISAITYIPITISTARENSDFSAFLFGFISLIAVLFAIMDIIEHCEKSFGSIKHGWILAAFTVLYIIAAFVFCVLAVALNWIGVISYLATGFALSLYLFSKAWNYYDALKATNR